MRTFALLLTGFAFFATAATANETTDIENQIDCEDEANKDDEACVILPDGNDVQNFIPGILPLLAGAGIVGSGLLGGNETTSTTSTTSTTTN